MTPRTITAAPPPPRTIYACDRVEQIKLLGDRILIRPLAWEPSKIIEVVRHGRPLRGEVMAVGPGHNPLKYRKVNGKKLMDYSKRFRPTEVRVGDVVELGGLNIFDGKGYEFPQVMVGLESMLIATERDVVGVVGPYWRVEEEIDAQASRRKDLLLGALQAGPTQAETTTQAETNQSVPTQE
jgi:hypothetical protein